ncbi:glycoside hydrolase family 55 protein [Mucilaginibacter sp. SMC90]|uniref:glycoside hydrolase family 55 protein n=1 Tax=Mucilaginibacter sp. SMC90 TaxID=2929803 RepID=UPI001FB3B87C|nr:glycoside hydrolase family 55 protein [Mucilaginibacter sp. SMC90]UOE52386.1 glycoside hydrolase family 55 protein [Mucilaginibacter sp. SMC90]
MIQLFAVQKDETHFRSTVIPVDRKDFRAVNIKDHGAKGDGITDDTQPIREAIIFAHSNNIPTVWFPEGRYLIKDPGTKPGVIKLMSGVSLAGDGPIKTHIILSGGRMNPVSIFYQEWREEPSIDNISIRGIDFDGNLSKQQFDPGYQFCHALSINNGKNIEVKNCKFQSFRGDGLLFGDTFEQTLNARIVSDVRVHNCEFFNIYREGTMFCCVNGASFYSNWVHGSGYLVGGVDIERHSANETVMNVAVYNNVFDFRDGFGPVERGRIIKYRRAVTIGYFYDGYINGTADSLSGHHNIYNNKIYQGQIDCFGHLDVKINRNTIINTFEKLKGVLHVSTPAINVSDARSTEGLKNVIIDSNYIRSAIPGNGIVFYKYKQVNASHNILKGKNLGGVMLINSEGAVNANITQNN